MTLKNARLGIQEEVEANYTLWKMGITQIEALENAIDLTPEKRIP